MTTGHLNVVKNARQNETFDDDIRPQVRIGIALGEIIIAIDTSGSVSDTLLARFLAEIQSLLNTSKPKSITLMSCDWNLHNVQTFVPGQDLTSYVPKGGGGTAFEPVFDYIEENHPNPLCLIYFTDGEGSFPSEPPSYPTLWLHFGRENFRYPYGHKIEIPPIQAK